MKPKYMYIGLCVLGVVMCIVLSAAIQTRRQQPVAAPEAKPAAATPEVISTPAEVPPSPEETVVIEEQSPVEAEQVTPVVVSVGPTVLSDVEASRITTIVNKKNALPSTYEPTTASYRGSNMRPETVQALNSLFTAAESQGFTPKIISAYRSYGTQVSVYGNYVNQYGQAEADTFSARPGHSEHQTGLAVDVGNSDGSCDLDQCFGSTSFGAWVQGAAHVYGFVVRYPYGKEAVTGYMYEPWHLRYVGAEVAQAVYASGLTLDEYYSVPAGGYW
jgi:zinc D-Ala-D-Ala carboxypeptidase